MTRTKARLPFASEGGPIEIQLDDFQWKELEQELGSRLSASVRDQIVEITNGYLKFAPFKQSPPADSASDRLHTLSKAASKFHKALVEPAPDDDYVDFYVYSLIKKHFADASIGSAASSAAEPEQEVGGLLGPIKIAPSRAEYSVSTRAEWWRSVSGDDPIERLRGEVQSFIAACRLAAEELDERLHDPFPADSPWRRWIGNLTELFEKEGLPTRVRKDADASGRHSPFAKFVFSLQKNLPEKYRKGDHSEAACGEQISNSRKQLPETKEEKVRGE